MDTPIRELSDHLLLKLSALNTESSRILVGICGIPASGKTTLALNVVDRVNTLYRASRPKTDYDVAICVSQDGWHLPRSALDKFDDVKTAYDRRGAAFTFDGVAFSTFILSLRDTSKPTAVVDPSSASVTLSPSITPEASRPKSKVIYAPGFSHTLKDPIEREVAIYPRHRIVIVEGLYTFLGVEPWTSAAQALDERWFIRIDPKDARERLIRRHVVTGVAKDLEEAIWRADNNDMPNGLFIQENMLLPTRAIESCDDPVIASHGRTE